MSYPNSPFSNDNYTYKVLKSSITANNLRIKHEIEGTTNDGINKKLEELLIWLCKGPTISSYRINTTLTTVNIALQFFQNALSEVANKLNIISTPDVYISPHLKDVIIIENWQIDLLDLNPVEKEVIVDAQCGAAVLRGAHIFAPGVLAMESGISCGMKVSVYADLTGKCRKGFRDKYEANFKTFLGNGLVQMNRKQLFVDGVKPEGIAVEMISTTTGCLNVNFDSIGSGYVLLQNLPSIVCGHVLNPQPEDLVLDMCAAPGNKTTHIATLMNNRGTVIALEKVTSKILKLKERCTNFNAKCVHVFQYDATKAVCDTVSDSYDVTNGPPFQPRTFDKILLDGPCSGLGQRPQLLSKKSAAIHSYVPLQQKLFRTAWELLKPGGHLVYSTCTITTLENEDIVSWALQKFSNLELIPAEPRLGGLAWKTLDLSEEQCKKLQRFGPPSDELKETYCDSVGFFIAKFEKITC